MLQESDEDRIRRKAHELWEAEGRPHGRDQEHWDQAREIIAIQDSQASTLLPRNTGAEEPVESQFSVDSLGDVPGLTDQGKDDLTDVAREPTFTAAAPQPEATKPTAAKRKSVPPAAQEAFDETPGVSPPAIGSKSGKRAQAKLTGGAVLKSSIIDSPEAVNSNPAESVLSEAPRVLRQPKPRAKKRT